MSDQNGTVREKNTFPVTYPNGDRVLVKRFSATAKVGLKDFKELYAHLMLKFIEADGAVGELITDEEALGYMRQIAAIIPIAGKHEPGLDFDALLEADDWEQICQIFLSGSMQDNGEHEKNEAGEEILFRPSKLAHLNKLDFFGRMREATQKLQAQRMEATEKRLEESRKLLTSNSSLPAEVMS